MRDIGITEFTKDYQFIRKQPDSILGDWLMYRHVPTSSRRMVKEIKFMTPEDRGMYIKSLENCPLYHMSSWRGVPRFIEFVTREEGQDHGPGFVLLAIFEGYENSFEKLISRKVKNS